MSVQRAADYLARLIENDVRETMDMLQSGDFMDEEEDVALPPMHPRHSGHSGGVEGGTGDVDVGGEDTGMLATMPEPERGYGGGGEDADLPPMHPRGRR